MKPTQVVDMQADLIYRLEDPTVRRAWSGQMAMDIQKSMVQLTRDQAVGNGAAMIVIMRKLMQDAAAYYCSEDMGRLVVYAASQLEDTDRFNRQLAPTRSGLVRFEEPLQFLDIRGTTLLLSWMAWGPAMVSRGNDEPEEHTAMFMWNDHADHPDSIAALMGSDDPKVQSTYQRVVGRWGFIGGETFSDNMRMGPPYIEVDEERRAQIVADGAVPHGHTNPTRLLHAFWMLLSQTVADLREQPLDRPFARRAKRMNLPQRVTVIQLRRMEGVRHPGETMVEWNHRWVVKGHWRWQPYGPLGKTHAHEYGSTYVDGRVMIRECTMCDARVERIWIAPFVKGPDGKPLVVSDKVYALVR